MFQRLGYDEMNYYKPTSDWDVIWTYLHPYSGDKARAKEYDDTIHSPLNYQKVPYQTYIPPIKQYYTDSF